MQAALATLDLDQMDLSVDVVGSLGCDGVEVREEYALARLPQGPGHFFTDIQCA